SSRIRSSTSRPSKPGRFTSSSTRSGRGASWYGGWPRRNASASVPLLTVQIWFRTLARSSARRVSSTSSALSSTSRILMGREVSGMQPLGLEALVVHYDPHLQDGQGQSSDQVRPGVGRDAGANGRDTVRSVCPTPPGTSTENASRLSGRRKLSTSTVRTMRDAAHAASATANHNVPSAATRFIMPPQPQCPSMVHSRRMKAIGGPGPERAACAPHWTVGCPRYSPEWNHQHPCLRLRADGHRYTRDTQTAVGGGSGCIHSEDVAAGAGIRQTES